MPQPQLPLPRTELHDLCISRERPIRFASGVFSCLILAALISRANSETPTRLDAILGAGVLRVGLTEDYRPFSYAVASDKVQGIDVDMATYHVVVAFDRDAEGDLKPGEAREVLSLSISVEN